MRSAPFVQARSSRPSPLRSAAIKRRRRLPDRDRNRRGKCSAAEPFRMLMLLAPELAVARSSLPSPLKSPAAIGQWLHAGRKSNFAREIAAALIHQDRNIVAAACSPSRYRAVRCRNRPSQLPTGFVPTGRSIAG